MWCIFFASFHFISFYFSRHIYYSKRVNVNKTYFLYFGCNGNTEIRLYGYTVICNAVSPFGVIFTEYIYYVLNTIECLPLCCQLKMENVIRGNDKWKEWMSWGRNWAEGKKGNWKELHTLNNYISRLKPYDKCETPWFHSSSHRSNASNNLKMENDHCSNSQRAASTKTLSTKHNRIKTEIQTNRIEWTWHNHCELFQFLYTFVFYIDKVSHFARCEIQFKRNRY